MGCGDKLIVFNMLRDFAEVKVQWFREEEKGEAVRIFCVVFCTVMWGRLRSRIRNLPPYSTVAEKEMFAFDENEGDTASFNVDTKATEYLKSESDMEVLNRFPPIKSI